MRKITIGAELNMDVGLMASATAQVGFTEELGFKESTASLFGDIGVAAVGMRTYNTAAPKISIGYRVTGPHNEYEALGPQFKLSALAVPSSDFQSTRSLGYLIGLESGVSWCIGSMINDFGIGVMLGTVDGRIEGGFGLHNTFAWAL